MRTVLLLIAMGCSLLSFSQKNEARVILTKGQKFTLHTTSSQEADMGMGMEMKNNSTSQNNFYVIDANDKTYMVSKTLTGLKVSVEIMGQQTNYDSDLKEDSASEIGKSVKNLNIPDTISINKYTAAVSSNKKADSLSKEESMNPMESLFESFSDKNADEAISDAFFIIPTGKKTGESWIDSSSTKDQKSFKTFTIKSIEKNIATILVAGNVVSNIQAEAQGMQFTVSMNTKIDSEIITDPKTSLVAKRSTTNNITGNLEMMGQSVPITGKSTTTAVYEY